MMQLRHSRPENGISRPLSHKMNAQEQICKLRLEKIVPENPKKSNAARKGKSMQERKTFTLIKLPTEKFRPATSATARQFHGPEREGFGGEKAAGGDAAEIFLLSDPRIPCYREIVINGSGCVLSALHTKRRGEIYLNCRREAPERISTAAGSDPQGGWCFEAAVPFAELPGYFRGNPPRSGEELRLALVRTRDGGFFSAFPLLYSGHNLYGYAAAKLE